MLDMRDAGFDGVVPVDLGPVGKYNFLREREGSHSRRSRVAPQALFGAAFRDA